MPQCKAWAPPGCLLVGGWVGSTVCCSLVHMHARVFCRRFLFAHLCLLLMRMSRASPAPAHAAMGGQRDAARIFWYVSLEPAFSLVLMLLQCSTRSLAERPSPSSPRAHKQLLALLCCDLLQRWCDAFFCYCFFYVRVACAGPGWRRHHWCGWRRTLRYDSSFGFRAQTSRCQSLRKKLILTSSSSYTLQLLYDGIVFNPRSGP